MHARRRRSRWWVSRSARDCYDYASHVVWQWWAPELWRRFTITLRRLLAEDPRRARSRAGGSGDRAVRQGGGVPAPRRRSTSTPWSASTDPRTPDGFAAAPARIDSRLLARLVQTPPCSRSATGARCRRRRSRPGSWRSAASSTSELCASAAAPTTPTRRSRRSRSPATWPSTPPSPLDDTGPAAPPTPTRIRTTVRQLGCEPASPVCTVRRRRGLPAAGQVGAHARLPRPLRLQVPPLLDHPRRPPPGPPPGQHADCANTRKRWPASTSAAGSRPTCSPTRRRHHPGHRPAGATTAPAGTTRPNEPSLWPLRPAPASTPTVGPNRRTDTDWARGRENGGTADRGPALVGSGRVGVPRHTGADDVRVASAATGPLVG